MIRLEKHKIIDRLEEDEKKRLISEIKAAKKVTDLINEVIEEKIQHLESTLESDIESPYVLAAKVKTISELKKLTRLFKETTNDNN